MNKQYAIHARAALKEWQFNVSDLSDEQIVRLYHHECARRWEAFRVAARAAGSSVGRLARSFETFHHAIMKAAIPATQA